MHLKILGKQDRTKLQNSTEPDIRMIGKKLNEIKTTEQFSESNKEMLL